MRSLVALGRGVADAGLSVGVGGAGVGVGGVDGFDSGGVVAVALPGSADGTIPGVAVSSNATRDGAALGRG